MNRKVTNTIRFFLDECLPPIIRDNKYFMYPMFWIWYKGKNVKKCMEFKNYFHELTKASYNDLYDMVDSISYDRPTDLNKACINEIIKNIGNDKTQKIIDMGCGRGYFLEELKKKGYSNLYGCDLFDSLDIDGVTYIKGDIENLPFNNQEFDIVVCTHTIEHVMNLTSTINELKRIAKNKLIITVPCQKYFHYTFDFHIHFFPEKSYLLNTMNMKDYTCQKKGGDWVFIGYLASN